MSKHTPNTSEPSHPHVGSSGKEEIDRLHFGADGRKDNELTKQASHITDPAEVEMGRQKQASDQPKKP